MTNEEAIRWLKEDKKLYETSICHADDGTTDGELLMALDMAISALDKQIPKKRFINECGCVFEQDILESALEMKCMKLDKYCHDEYRITLHNNYPTICIAHEHFYVHNLIGEYLYGNIRKGYVIHHKDSNKLNALKDNLDYISCFMHSQIHGELRKGNDCRSEEGKWKGINAAKEKRYRKEITLEEIIRMQNEGVSNEDIAKHFNCGINTIYRRLGERY